LEGRKEREIKKARVRDGETRGEIEKREKR
jgi:hypothetical protein